MPKALLIIDMQKFVEERINQGINYYPLNAISNMELVLQRFRANNDVVLHVRHRTEQPDSSLHPSSPLYPAMDAFREKANEPVFFKNTSSAFASTHLKAWLDSHCISEVFIIGAVAGFCVHSTVREGSDLGVKMTVLKDAVLSFDIPALKKEARNIHAVTLALLETDFATVKSVRNYENISG